MADDPARSQCAQCGAPLPPERPAPVQSPPPTPQYANPAPDDSLTMGGYLVTLLVSLLPVAGFIMMLVWSFSSTAAPARRKLAQAYLVRTLIVSALIGLLAVLAGIAVLLLINRPFFGFSYLW
ncbi:MAG: hypothetical protein ACI4OI_04140 [Gemmiger sp.]